MAWGPEEGCRVSRDGRDSGAWEELSPEPEGGTTGKPRQAVI